MKKTIFDLLRYDFYRYAPESFKLFLCENNKYTELKINRETLKDFGYIVITKGEKELEKEVKRYFRKHTIFKKEIGQFNFGIRLKNSNDYVNFPHITVSQYNIKEHLYWYKELKRSLERNNYKNPIETTSATFDGNFNIKEIKKHDDKLELSNRIYLKAV